MSVWPQSKGIELEQGGAVEVSGPFAGYGDVLTVKELCEITGLSDQTIRVMS